MATNNIDIALRQPANLDEMEIQANVNISSNLLKCNVARVGDLEVGDITVDNIECQSNNLNFYHILNFDSRYLFCLASLKFSLKIPI